MENLIITLVNGLSLGGIYAMIALGYTMVYGIAKMLNFAHGDIIMVGGYAIFIFLTVNPFVAIIASIIISVVLGILTEKLAYKPLRGTSPLAVLITAIGVSYFLQCLAQIIFGSAPKTPDIFGDLGSLKIGSVSISIGSIITLVSCLAIMLSLTFFVKYSKTGRGMLAVSEDKEAAQLMGINVNRTITITFAIGSALASLAALFFLMRVPSLSPTLGAMPGIKAFTAAVIGGIGSIPGAMIGGLLLGVVECFSLSVSAIAPYTDAIEFAILIIILLVRPNGILGKRKREKV